MLVCLCLLQFGCASTPDSGQSQNEAIRNGDKALVFARLARGYLQQKQYAVARDELKRALRINPQHSESNYVMALLMVELEQYDVAEKHFARAVRNDQQNSAAAHDFGMMLCQLNREKESVKYFNIAASNPLFSRAELSHMRAGECLARINDDRAEDYLRRALSVNPTLGPALYRLAKLKYDNQSYFSARAYIERFLAVSKPRPAELLLAYKIETGLNAMEMAEEYRQRLLTQYPASPQARHLRQR